MMAAGTPEAPLPSSAFQLLLVDLVVFPGQMRSINPSRQFWVHPRVSNQLDVPGKLPKGAGLDDPDQMPELQYPGYCGGGGGVPMILGAGCWGGNCPW